MECESFLKNERNRVGRGRWAGAQPGGRGSGAGAGGGPPRAAARSRLTDAAAPGQLPITDCVLRFNVPFMSKMDEISYWIYTKRAPCLMNYDKVKEQEEEAHCSKPTVKSVPSVAEVPSPKKKKKRKLSLLDDDSLSEKGHNVYFDASQEQKNTPVGDCESDTVGSYIDFNIKNPSVQEKPKRKLQRNNRSTLHKKNTVVTSTPKACTLRRSLRQAQQSLNNSHLNSSFEIFNTSIINGNSLKCSAIGQTPVKKPELLAGGDRSVDNKNNVVINNNSKNEVLNGQFDDMSDVSGFTANYIRSTKLQLKTPRKSRCKSSRNLVKESHPSIPKDNTFVCVNKSMNTGLPSSKVLNCSADSSQNVINMITTNSNQKTTKVTKSTSILKFMGAKSSKNRDSVKNSKLNSVRTRSKLNLNISFESKNSSTSRYPKRFKNNAVGQNITVANSTNVPNNKIKACNISGEMNNSDRKENPESTYVSKTRSGRSIGLAHRHPENSVLVLSNSTKPVSSMAGMNVASPSAEQQAKVKKKRRVTRHARLKNSMDKNVTLQRDSLREKSGFGACFSDSDEDSEPLRQRKFFCA